MWIRSNRWLLVSSLYMNGCTGRRVFILDGGDLSLACALIQSAETPGRGTESRSGFSWTPQSPALLFSSSWFVSIYFKQIWLLWFGLTINLDKYRLFWWAAWVIRLPKILHQSGIRLRGTCFVSDTPCTRHMMAVLAWTGKVEWFNSSLLSLLILISI